uniref:Uncharacterized protein LOC104221083 n=1 Tax=Nicotiana sylvestris TaxID=4096 RepID=A0A1U7VZH4_NICSY|nr:PREDICTED: uncharacterized protein LOC104221083 [Nicotiana sylvestris]
MQQYARDFERLVPTPDMDVSTYNTKFCNLAIYVPHLVPIEEARVQRFVDGLIENKGREERVASDLRKKAKTGGAFGGGFSENRRVGNQGQQQQQGSQIGTICLHSPHTDHITDKLGHHLRDCPQPPRNFNQAFIQSAAPTQTTRNTSGATGTGNRGRGAGNCATMNQGQGNDAQASNVVVTCILSICSFDALALIDPGSTHSYVSLYFALRFSRQPELLNDPFLVATHVGESLLAEYVYRACQIRVEVDCHTKIVKFEIPNEPSFILRGSQVPETCKIVSFMKAQRLLKN